MYLKAKAINPEFRFAYEGLGQIYIEWKRYDEAIKCFEKAIQKKSLHFMAYGYLAEIYALHLNDKDKAIALLQTFEDNLMKWGKKDKDSRLSHTIGIAALYLRINSLDEFNNLLDQAIEYNNDRAAVWNRITGQVIYLKMNRNIEKNLLTILELNPLEFKANMRLSYIYRIEQSNHKKYKRFLKIFVKNLHNWVDENGYINSKDNYYSILSDAVDTYSKRNNNSMINWLQSESIKLCQKIINSTPDNEKKFRDYESVFIRHNHLSSFSSASAKFKICYVNFWHPEVVIVDIYKYYVNNSTEKRKQNYIDKLLSIKPMDQRTFPTLAYYHIKYGSAAKADSLYDLALKSSKYKKSEAKQIAEIVRGNGKDRYYMKYLDISRNSVDEKNDFLIQGKYEIGH